LHHEPSHADRRVDAAPAVSCQIEFDKQIAREEGAQNGLDLSGMTAGSSAVGKKNRKSLILQMKRGLVLAARLALNSPPSAGRCRGTGDQCVRLARVAPVLNDPHHNSCNPSQFSTPARPACVKKNSQRQRTVGRGLTEEAILAISGGNIQVQRGHSAEIRNFFCDGDAIDLSIIDLNVITRTMKYPSSAQSTVDVCKTVRSCR
jgi:hypothetical protein